MFFVAYLHYNYMTVCINEEKKDCTVNIQPYILFYIVTIVINILLQKQNNKSYMALFILHIGYSWFLYTGIRLSFSGITTFRNVPA